MSVKKAFVCFTLLVMLALSSTIRAAKTGDFELGGYIKLMAYWDSTSSVNKNITLVTTRNNAPRPAHEGRTRFTAQNTHLNFKITGPEIWGAQTQGFIELDFNGGGPDPQVDASSSYLPRLRHAWFRLNWPSGWEILMGQYWGVFNNFFPETVNADPMLFHGMAIQRFPQVRVSYTTGPWTFTTLMGAPYDPGNDDNAAGALVDVNGSQILSETFPGGNESLIGQRGLIPQFGMQVQFEQDLWGKAAFFGRPRGLVANLSFGIQRNRYDGGVFLGRTWGQNNFTATAIPAVQPNTVLTPWVVQTTLFIPVVPTKTKDLRGTASITAQFQIGQGLSFIGGGRNQDNTFFAFNGFLNNFDGFQGTVLPEYQPRLQKRYGGYLQCQYYINNAWFVNYVYGFSKAYGVTQARNGALANFLGVLNPEGYEYLTIQDQIRDIQEHNFSLWYRPIKNFKFGLGYSYLRTNYFQITTVGSRQTRLGDNHRVQSAGYFFF